ncbi:MAG: NTP transferase domain-containing protein [Muribaculaceae bacterium]|nr:NTP transferase domain-containing protein [Muribaculaceae bacterium]
MKAMILCAGLGTRLKPWTLSHPKALVPVGGEPMLKRVSSSLMNQGFDTQIINVHHFADQVIDYVAAGSLGGVDVKISDESELLLDTGGGILNASGMLAADDAPFLVHNVDILSNADLRRLYETHVASGRDVTLLVSDRDSSRKLVFDDADNLAGWINVASGETRPAGFLPKNNHRELAFSGIYVMSPSVLSTMRENGYSGAFPIMDFFLSIIGTLSIGAVSQPGLEILDIGKPDALRRAELMFG